MSHASNSEFAPVGPSQSGRLAILAFGVPSLVIWALAVRYSLPVLLHIVGQTPSGMDSANGGRVLYIVLVGIIALCGATLSAGMLRRAWKGKAPVWSAAITLCAAVLGFLLVGLIGD